MLPFVLAAVVSAPLVQDRLPQIVEQIERHYDSTSDFEASFTQRYERRLLRRKVEEKGKVSVKKPGRMRWEYRSPEEKVFVTDGTKTYFYLPAENQVMVSHQPQGAMGMEAGSPFELLAGRGRLSDSFHRGSIRRARDRGRDRPPAGPEETERRVRGRRARGRAGRRAGSCAWS